MRRPVAALGSTAFFLAAPGVVAGVVPWWLTRWRPDAEYPWPLRVLGLALIGAGGAVLVHAFARFVVEGLGTPAPVAPTEHLVVGGLYRYVRNPMYVAVLALIVGQGMVFGSVTLLLYALAVFAAVFSFVRGYEEPTLARRFGTEYEAYRRGVPGWIPRRLPWRSGAT